MAQEHPVLEMVSLSLIILSGLVFSKIVQSQFEPMRDVTSPLGSHEYAYKINTLRKKKTPFTYRFIQISKAFTAS